MLRVKTWLQDTPALSRCAGVTSIPDVSSSGPPLFRMKAVLEASAQAPLRQEAAGACNEHCRLAVFQMEAAARISVPSDTDTAPYELFCW